MRTLLAFQLLIAFQFGVASPVCPPQGLAALQPCTGTNSSAFRFTPRSCSGLPARSTSRPWETVSESDACFACGRTLALGGPAHPEELAVNAIQLATARSIHPRGTRWPRRGEALVNERFDIIIVGTGFAGAFFLMRYLERAPSHARVLVLDRGREDSKAWQLRNRLTSSIPQEELFFNRTPGHLWLTSPGFGGNSKCWWAGAMR